MFVENKSDSPLLFLCEAVFASHETMAYEKVKLLHVACVANTGTRNATHSKQHTTHNILLTQRQIKYKILIIVIIENEI